MEWIIIMEVLLGNEVRVGMKRPGPSINTDSLKLFNMQKIKL